MRTPIETVTHNGYVIKIYCEEDPLNPRNHMECLTTMACTHRSYNLGDDCNIPFNDFRSWKEVEKYIERTFKPVLIKPLFMYDHSGITIATSPFSCRWDSGKIGYVFVTRGQLAALCGINRVTRKKLADIDTWLENEVETYDQYLRGDVYRFEVEDKNGNELDSCNGFFGTDWETNGLLDEAKSMIPDNKLAA